MQNERRDVIRWSIDWLLANCESLTPEQAARFELEARREWGGHEVRVWRTSTGKAGRPSKVTPAAYADSISSAPTEVVAATHGLSRSTIYRLVKRDPP